MIHYLPSALAAWADISLLIIAIEGYGTEVAQIIALDTTMALAHRASQHSGKHRSIADSSSHIQAGVAAYALLVMLCG